MSTTHLSSIFLSPSLDEADAYVTDLNELVDSLKPLLHTMLQFIGKVFNVEDAPEATCNA